MKCLENGCEKEAYRRGYCSKCYRRKLKSGELPRVIFHEVKYCSVDGCANKHYCKGYCCKHYNRFRINGTIELAGRIKYNKIYFNYPFALIEINSKVYGTMYAKVDIEDYWIVKDYTWSLAKRNDTFYVATSDYKNNHENLLLHRLLLPNSKEVDHEDMNGLNNTRKNLRECTKSQNGMNKKKYKNNTSGYKCVYFNKKRKKYEAYIVKNKKKKHIGYFDTAIKAAKAYDKKAIELFGKFNNLNFPIEDYQ